MKINKIIHATTVVIFSGLLIISCNSKESDSGKEESAKIDSTRLEPTDKLGNIIIPINRLEAISMQKEDSVRWSNTSRSSPYVGEFYAFPKSTLLYILDKADTEDSFYVEMGIGADEKNYTIFVGLRKIVNEKVEAPRHMISATKVPYDRKYNNFIRTQNTNFHNRGIAGFDPSKNFEGVIFDVENSKKWLNDQNGDFIYLYPSYDSKNEYSTVIFHTALIDFQNTNSLRSDIDFGNRGTGCCP